MPAVRWTGLTDLGNTWSRWEKLFWVTNRKLELPCSQDRASHVSALAMRLWDWLLCDSGFRDYWVSSAVIEFTRVYLSELATGQHSQEPFGTSSRAILLACQLKDLTVGTGQACSWRVLHRQDSPEETCCLFCPSIPLSEMSNYRQLPLWEHGIVGDVCVKKASMFERSILCGHPNGWLPHGPLAVLSAFRV